MKQLYYSIFIILALLWNISCNDDENEPEVKLAVVTTSENVKELTSTSAIVEGNLVADGLPTITQKGICYSTTPTPTVDNKSKAKEGNAVGSFEIELKELESATTYYVRAYAINSVGVAYGNEVNFRTQAKQPEVSVLGVSQIARRSAVCNGNVTSESDVTISVKGICWDTSENPTIQNNKTTNGESIGDFQAEMTDLSPETTYYVRAYATDNFGNTHYSTQTTFKTLDTSSGSGSEEWGDGGTWKP